MTKVVAIDAGHGINTPGKRTPDGEREWSFNSVVAQAIIDNLKKYKGVKTVRLDDPAGKRDVPLKERTNKANSAKADILVSCHHNANTGKWGNWTGTETYHYPGSTKGKQLAQAIHPEVVKAYGLRDRGIKSANFHMLRESRMPAILIEGGFMDSTIDIKKLRDKKVLKQAGKNVADAVAKYFNLKKKATPKPGKPSNKLYKVQIGAFSKKKNADNLAKKAKSKGFDTYIVKEKNLYKVQIGAYSKLENAQKQANKAKKAGFDVYIDGDSKPTPNPKEFKTGQKVKIKQSAKKYATGQNIPRWVKEKSHTIKQIKSDRVLLKEIYSWVYKKDLQ